MLNSIKKLDGYRILASNGEVGTVAEAYFDDEQWVVRYLVVDTGGWLTGPKRVDLPVRCEVHRAADACNCCESDSRAGGAQSGH